MSLSSELSKIIGEHCSEEYIPIPADMAVKIAFSLGYLEEIEATIKKWESYLQRRTNPHSQNVRKGSGYITAQ